MSNDATAGDPTIDNVALRVLLDKQEISEILVRYMRSVDRGDVDGVRACYHPGATEDHGGLFEGSADDYVDSIADALTYRHALSSHVVTNILVDVTGDRATSECYATTFTRIWTGTTTADSIVGARLLDRFERRDGRWGITHRQMLWEWNHDMDTAEGWLHRLLPADQLIKGTKFPHDPVYSHGTDQTDSQP